MRTLSRKIAPSCRAKNVIEARRYIRLYDRSVKNHWITKLQKNLKQKSIFFADVLKASLKMLIERLCYLCYSILDCTHMRKILKSPSRMSSRTDTSCHRNTGIGVLVMNIYHVLYSRWCQGWIQDFQKLGPRWVTAPKRWSPPTNSLLSFCWNWISVFIKKEIFSFQSI